MPILFHYSNYFELVRFDFVLDKDLNVYLMEVNMSPNLSSAHFYANRLLYEHVMYGLLSVVGVLRDTSNMPETRYQNGGCWEMIDILVSRHVPQ